MSVGRGFGRGGAATLVAVVLTSATAAAQVSVAVSAPASLAPGEPALVRVEVTAPASATVRLIPPDVAPFTVASATRLADPGARAGWQRQEWRYLLTPPYAARGRYAFEPFVAEAQGAGLRAARVESRPWSLEVRGAGGATAAAPGPGPRAAVPNGSPGAAPAAPAAPAVPRTGVAFTARVTPAAVYVGQQATYELTVAVSAEARARIRRSPEFVPPELRGVLAYDLPATHRGGPDGDVHVYRRALFPLAPGVVQVPAARLNYSLAAGVGFFSPEERQSVSSGAVRLTAVAPPAAGRPAGWDGAVGSFRATARAAPAAVRAGDVVEYTVELDGVGDVALLPRPRLDVPWADAVVADDRAAVDSGAMLVRGRRTFTWLLTPRAPGRFATPPITYPFFDPATRTYGVATAESRPVEVRAGAVPVAAASPSGRASDALPIPAAWRGETPAPLALRPGFWVTLALAPAPAALVALWAGVRGAGRLRRAAAGRSLPGGAAGAPRGAAALRLALDRALVDRLGFGVSAFAARGGLVAALRRSGVSTETARRAARLAAALDQAAYDARPSDGTRPDDAALAELRRELDAVRRDVDREARPRAELLGARGALDAAARVLVAAVALGAAGVVACAGRAAEANPRAVARYTAGTRAYAAGNLDGARRAFTALAADAPRSPEAWTAAGTAAWAAGDTVAAAVAWQRALRLNPRDAAVRDRLALLPTVQDESVARVPPVSPDWPAGAALALAGVAALLALPPVRRRTRRPVWAACWGAALAAGGAAAALAAYTRPDALAVVRAPGPLRAEPALDAEPGPRADVTDVARVVERAGAWARVELAGDRAGWIAVDRLVPLETARRGAGPVDAAR